MEEEEVTLQFTQAQSGELRALSLGLERSQLCTNKPGDGYKGGSSFITQGCKKQEESGILVGGVESELETTLEKCVHAVG